MDKDFWIVLVIGLVCVGWVRWKWWQRSREAQAPAGQERVARPLRPRTPDDGPECRRLGESPPGAKSSGVIVQPWSEVKSRRGRKKSIDTEGYACWNAACGYYGITNGQVHALVSFGSHGQSERIQDLWCAACGKKVTQRRETALYRLKTPGQRVGEVLAALAEGMEVARRAGIRVCMITGDYRRTAERIGRGIGLFREGDETIDGEELARLDDQQLQKQVPHTAIFARIHPDVPSRCAPKCSTKPCKRPEHEKNRNFCPTVCQARRHRRDALQ